MIVLKRSFSKKYEALDVILRRCVLDEQEREFYREQLLKLELGMEGERRADRYWEDLQLSFPHYLLHGYETENERGYSHQIDTVLLTQKFMLLVELKNIGGIIRYDERLHQFTRELNGEILSLNDPFAQLARHEAFMEKLLEQIGVKLPILCAVIFTSSSSILEEMPESVSIFKLPGLRFKLKKWLDVYDVKISESMLQLVKDELLVRMKAKQWSLPKQFEYRRGAICSCGNKMIYARKKFSCACGQVKREVLYQGLHDYRVLVGEWITNRQFRMFFQINSEHVANKLLRQLNLHAEGDTKAKRYYIPKNIWRNASLY